MTLTTRRKTVQFEIVSNHHEYTLYVSSWITSHSTQTDWQHRTNVELQRHKRRDPSYVAGMAQWTQVKNAPGGKT